MPIKYVLIRAGNGGVEVREFDVIFGAHPFSSPGIVDEEINKMSLIIGFLWTTLYCTDLSIVNIFDVS